MKFTSAIYLFTPKTTCMRKIIICTFLLALATASFEQQTAPKQHWTETDYYKKSKHQKTAAWVFTGAGSAILLTTLFVEAFSTAVTLGESKATGTTLPYVIGGACVATGVVFFFASGKNKKKAKAVSVFMNIERVPVLQAAEISNQSFPVLGLRISLSKPTDKIQKS